tara:strand:- start:90 stop:695 length:606 start_codon:yes stop_codon:yes gene_type:complete
MSSNEEPIFESNEVIEVAEPVKEHVEPVEVAEVKAETEVKAKPVKKKRVLTSSQLERLRAQLKKGRETSLANRKKKAQLKRIDKEDKNKADDEKIYQAMKKKLRPSELETENADLRRQLAEFKKAQQAVKVEPVKAKAVKVKKVKPAKSAATEDSDDDMIQVRSKSVIIENEQKPKAKKVFKKAEPKQMSKRDMLKLMKGL